MKLRGLSGIAVLKHAFTCSRERVRSVYIAKPTKSVLGRPYLDMTQLEVCEYIVAALHSRQGGWLLTANASILRQLDGDDSLASMTRPADLTADGMPIIWASRLSSEGLPGRVCGSDLILSLSRAVGSGLGGVYLVGGNLGTATLAAAVIDAHAESKVVVGEFFLPFDYEYDPDILGALEDDLIKVQPAVVFVALGFPKGEVLISRLRIVLPRAWFVGVGISFSFLADEVHRAPRWLQRVGMEWLHRLVQEPRRLAPRYSRDMPYVIGMLTQALSDGVKKRMNCP